MILFLQFSTGMELHWWGNSVSKGSKLPFFLAFRRDV